jgi:hypothetical protein
MKNLPFSWRKKGADLYEVGEKKVMTLLKATHRGIDGCCQDSAGSTRPREEAGTLTTGLLSCPMVIFEGFKVCSRSNTSMARETPFIA